MPGASTEKTDMSQEGVDTHVDRLVKLFKQSKRITCLCTNQHHNHNRGFSTSIDLMPVYCKTIPGLHNVTISDIEIRIFDTYNHVRLGTTNRAVYACKSFYDRKYEPDEFFKIAAEHVIFWCQHGRCIECGHFYSKTEEVHTCRAEQTAIFYNITPEKCGICLETTSGVCILECGHRFHHACVQGLETDDESDPKCPMCRKKLGARDMNRYFARDPYCDYESDNDDDNEMETENPEG